MARRTWVSVHRWAAGLGGALLILFSITGVWHQLQNYIPPLGRVPVGPEAKLDLSRLELSPAEAADLALRDGGEGAEIRSIALRALGSHLVYEVRTSAGARILSAEDGESLRLTAEEAERLVRERFGLGARLLEHRYQERISSTYWGEVGFPAHVFTEPDRPSTVYVVSPTDGRTFAGTLMSRINMGVMRAHTLWPIGEFTSGKVQGAALFVSGLLCVLIGITGGVLLFPLRWRR